MAERAFDLGRVLMNVEAIKAARGNNATADLERQYIGENQGFRRSADARATAADTRANAAEGRKATEFGEEQTFAGLQMLNTAAAEIAVNPSSAARWAPQLQKAGVPNEVIAPLSQPGAAKSIYDSTTKAIEAHQRTGVGGRVQSTQILENGNIGLVMRDGSVRDTGQTAKPQMAINEVAGVPTVTRLTGTSTSQTPLTTLPAVAGAAGTVAGAQATARGEAENATAREAKEPALATLEYVTEQFLPALTTTPTGGPMGSASMVGSVFDYQDAARFDNLKEQLSTELRTVFRIPGEGALSDREQAQYGLQLPDRKYSPAVNEAIIKDVNNRASLRIKGTRAGGGGGQPTASTFASEADAEAAARAGTLKPGTRITINGVAGTWQ